LVKLGYFDSISDEKCIFRIIMLCVNWFCINSSIIFIILTAYKLENLGFS